MVLEKEIVGFTVNFPVIIGTWYVLLSHLPRHSSTKFLCTEVVSFYACSLPGICVRLGTLRKIYNGALVHLTDVTVLTVRLYGHQ